MGKGLIRSLEGGPVQQRALIPHRSTFDFDFIATSIVAGNGGGGAPIFKLPEGNFLLFGATCQVQFNGTEQTDLTETWGGNFAIGTQQEPAGNDLNGASSNILPITIVPAATSRISPLVSGRTGGDQMIDNTDGNLEMFINLSIINTDIADNGAAGMIGGGVINLLYAVIGDD